MTRASAAAVADEIGGAAGWPLVGADVMRALDQHTIEKLGVPGDVLMESAGRAVVEVVLERLRSLGVDSDVVVVCGPGYNGGDGFVIARHLHLSGTAVRIALLGDPERLAGDALCNWKRAVAVGVARAGPRWGVAPRGLIVDAIFGTGLGRPLAGDVAGAVRRIERARVGGATVVAVDLPSGLDSDTGAALGMAVRADVTVTIGLPKLGLALEPGSSHAGEILVARIGIVDRAPGAEPEALLYTPARAAASLPERVATGHKGSFGHVLIAAGSTGKTGAAALAAHGALRAGAGLVTIACPASTNAILEVKCTEAMTAPLPETHSGSFSVEATAPLTKLARERDVIVIGPGIGRDDETLAAVRSVVGELAARPAVLDADALFAFSGASQLGALQARCAPTILTPHPGEAARLLGMTASEVNANRVAVARALARECAACVILKGAGTVIASADGRIVINPTGGPVLGTGGTGDVLAGMVGALLAQAGKAADPLDAAALAAYLHGAAGDRLARRIGRSGILASEVAAEVPAATEALRLQTRAASQRSASGEEQADERRAHERAARAGAALLPFPGT